MGRELLLVLVIIASVFAQECTQTCETSAFTVDAESPIYDAELLEKIYEQAKEIKQQNTALPPLILVPGLTGSGLQSKLDQADLPLLCTKTQDWERIWIQPNKLLQVNCFTDTLKLYYDTTTEQFHNADGIQIAPIDFSGYDGVSYLAWDAQGQPIASTDYMESIITYLQSAGYTSQNLTAAPYDWRQTSNPSGFNAEFQSLVETLYSDNGNTPVFILAHSMGNLEVGAFLNTVDQAWKDQYIGGFISAAAPWSGASLTLRATISGLEFKVGIVTIPPSIVRDLVQTWGSLVWMAPDQYLRGDEPVVVTPTVNYTYSDLGQLFTDIGADQAAEVFADLDGNLASFGNPGVDLYCLYGSNKATELWYEYGNGLSEQPTCIHCDNGDGVVPIQSLLRCLDMNPVQSETFNLVGHMDLIKDPLFFSSVLTILQQASAN